jgi:hypothetical protein
MKTVLTLVMVFFFGVIAYANSGEQVKKLNLKSVSYVEVSHTQMDSVLDRGIIVASDSIEDQIANEKSVARLYKFKNSRIKKALTFRTKKSKPKMA